MDLSWSTTTSRKTSLLEDENEPHFLMMDSDVTQHSMDSLDGSNSEVELNKLERCRTMPVSALYAAMDAEEDQAKRFANGRSLSMSSIGSLWDQGYKQRATEYNKELLDTAVSTDDEDTQNAHAFRLHTPIPEEDCSSDESITYVFMNPSSPPSSSPTNPSAILRHETETANKKKGFICSPARAISQQPRTLSMDSIDVEQYMNFINRSDSQRSLHKPFVETPHTTLERKLKRENSGIRIESTDQEHSGAEQTPYYVEGVTTDPETGPEHSPRLWNFLKKKPQLDSGSDHEGKNPSGKFYRPPSTSGRRQTAKVRRKPSRSRVVETQTDDEITGVSSTPSSPGFSRKQVFEAHPKNNSYALMRSLTSGGPFTEAAHQLSKGQLEPTVHLLTEVVSLMKMMMTNMQQQTCQQNQCCHKCKCNVVDIKELPTARKSPKVPNKRPSTLNLSALSDTASSDPEPSPSLNRETIFKEGFLIERFRQSRQDRIATCKSTSDIASCASDVEPDSLRLSGASTPTDEFRAFPILRPTKEVTTKVEKNSKLDHADSGISDRWESQASSSGSSTMSRRNRSRVSSESMSAGPSSLSSSDMADSSLGATGPVLTQWAQLGENPIRTSTPVHMTSWAASQHKKQEEEDEENNFNVNTSTETSASYKTTKSHLSRNDSVDDDAEISRKIITRPSKLEMKKERERREKEELRHHPGKKSPLDELKMKWLTPCDSLIPGDDFMFLPTQTRLRCSPDVPHTP